MRERKIFITLALILGVMLLGIVYAAITTQTLNVAGNATAVASADNFKVNFSGDPVVTKSTTASNATVTASASGKSGTFNISGLDTKNEYVEIKFPIKNTSADLSAVLSNVQVTNSDTNKTWWDVTASLQSTTLAASTGTTNLVVRVTLKDTPATDTEAPKGTFHVTFAANPQ